MDQTARSRALRIAYWQVLAGWAVLLATLIARVTTVVLQFARSSHDTELLIESLLKSVVLFVLVVFYRQHRWPSYFMLALWPVSYALTWWFVHPPIWIMILGLGVGLAFLAGAVGMQTIHRLQTRPDVDAA